MRARIAMHRGDVRAARRELVNAQRLRPLLNYAQPYLAVQARIEMTRVYLALADLAGARTLMQEIDEVLQWRGEARPLPHRGDEARPGISCDGVMAGELRDQTAGFREILRQLAMIHQGFAQDKARLGLDLARASALMPRRRR